MLTEKYDFRITDQMTIPLRPHWIANDSYREKCKTIASKQVLAGLRFIYIQAIN